MRQQRRDSNRKIEQVSIFMILIIMIFIVGCITPETEQPGAKLTIEEAMAIARHSDCVREGKLNESYVYNAYTRTWWIDLDPYIKREGCYPICVVFEETETAEIYWVCHGS